MRIRLLLVEYLVSLVILGFIILGRISDWILAVCLLGFSGVVWFVFREISTETSYSRGPWSLSMILYSSYRLLRLRLLLVILIVVLGSLVLGLEFPQLHPFLQHLWTVLSSVRRSDAILATAILPFIFTLGIAYSTTKNWASRTENAEWRGIESLVRSINPAIDIGITLVGVVALLIVSNPFPHTQSYCMFGVAVAVLSSTVMLANWYLTGIVFKHKEFKLGGDDVLLVQELRQRQISWILLNLSVALVFWVIWSVFAVLLTIGFW